MPQCEQIEAKLAAVVDGRADKSTRAEVEKHLSSCLRCRRLVQEQTAVRHQLRLLGSRDASHLPPAPLWERAAAAWDAQDARLHQAGKLRWILAGACMSMLLLSVVWAHLAGSHEFPVAAAFQDYHIVHMALPTPALTTSDADRAARWLRERLNTDLPPLNLSLSRSELLGADIITLPERRVGRLLYRTSQGGVTAVYVVPGGTHFTQTLPQLMEDHDFQVKTSKEARLYGWTVNGVGYGVLTTQPDSSERTLVLNAEHASELPTTGE